MLVLVFSDNFSLMFLGWEGIGLSSFLLISFWFNRIQAGKSAIKAMLVNRVGDLGLVLAISSTFLTFKSLDYSLVFSLSPVATNSTLTFLSFEFDSISLISFLIFIGVLGKSSQIGLHTWLGDAMEGPTPVSALIHAATLVTAGVFLIIRCSYFFEFSPVCLNILCLVGGLTAFFAATIGLVQSDIKKVIAYSTLSQLGYMVFACGISNYSISLFHLANHALFKALLFLGAGSIIHGLSDQQDMRKMGGLFNYFPITSTSILIGSIALTGIPFFTGFYSKDLILENALSSYNLVGNYAYFFGCLAACCTSFYSFRLFFLVFVNKTNGMKKIIESAHEPSFFMIFPLLILSIGSIFSGFVLKDLFSGLGNCSFQNSIFNLYKPLIFDSEFILSFYKQVPLFFSLLGVTLSFFLIYDKQLKFCNKKILDFKIFSARKMIVFLTNKWNFDQIYNEFITSRIMLFGYKVNFKTLDKGFIENYGPFGVVKNLSLSSKVTSFIQTGFLFHYILVTFTSLLLIFIYFFSENFLYFHHLILFFSLLLIS
jgi:proton-translocating NADH-quinone oxidoreductase chain L